MGSKVHYDDDLFFLQSVVRVLESALKLELDPELFHDKIIEDVFFVDASLLRLHNSLKENTFLINRAAYLRTLRRSVGSFIEFLEAATRSSSSVLIDRTVWEDRLAGTIRNQRSVLTEIDRTIDSSVSGDEVVDVVSHEETSFLLAHDAEEDPV